jgi:hypothetical protein
MSYNYNPQPPRVWSRVQHECSTINDSNSNNNNTITTEIDKQMLLKGNILQYKKNSSNLTKNQRYSKIAKGQWTNRTKSWATQTQSYSNPNTSNLLRVNYAKIPVPSNAVLTLDCSGNFIKDGGNLICNAVADPCTDVVIKTTQNPLCYSTTYSDVPGPPQQLCWNNGTQTWYPRQNLTMNNSTNKWPEGYKGFVSAVSPGAPYLMVDVSGNNANLTWKIIFDTCLPVNSFNIYKDGQFIANVPYPTTSYNNILLIDCVTTFYVTAVSGVNESGPSNYVNAYKPSSFSATGSYTTSYNPSTEFYTITFFSSGTIQFLCQDNFNNPISVVLVGGGGGGAGGSNTPNTVKGGAGGGGAQTNYFSTTSYTNGVIYNIVIGLRGAGGPPGTPISVPPSNGGDGGTSSIFTYNALGGQGGQASQGGDGGGSGLNGGAVSEPTTYSNGTGGIGVNSGTLYGGGGGGGGADGGGPAPDASLNVAGGGGGGVAYDISNNVITTAGGGGGGGATSGDGYSGGIGGQLYGGAGANSNGSNGGIGIYGSGGGGGSGAQNNTTSPDYGAGYGGNGGNGICVLKFKLTY